MEIREILSENLEQNFFISFVPEIMDFTDEVNPEIKLQFQNGRSYTIILEKDLPLIIEMLKLSIFAKNKKVLTWNWKNFISYLLAKTGKLYTIEGTIIDLKILESYSGIKKKVPKTLVEALNRLKTVVSTTWKEIEPVYKNLHIPLITTVIPKLEVVGILSKPENNKVYAYYEIDGQDNGRLKCHKAYKAGFVPHVLRAEEKNNLLPRQDEFFMFFDFKAMEVYILAWLSKDPLLNELCQKKDVYLEIYERIYDKKGEEKDRILAKNIFLPVIYGKRDDPLIVDKIHKLFPVALDYVTKSEMVQEKQLDVYAKDFFGKRRYFGVGEEYLIRNFLIQSPASVVCLEKLVQLYYSLKEKTDIVISVHDGYFLYANKDNWQEIYKIGKDVLTDESKFCPGLKLSVVCRGGRNLNNLKLIKGN